MRLQLNLLAHSARARTTRQQRLSLTFTALERNGMDHAQLELTIERAQPSNGS